MFACMVWILACAAYFACFFYSSMTTAAINHLPSKHRLTGSPTNTDLPIGAYVYASSYHLCFVTYGEFVKFRTVPLPSIYRRTIDEFIPVSPCLSRWPTPVSSRSWSPCWAWWTCEKPLLTVCTTSATRAWSRPARCSWSSLCSACSSRRPCSLCWILSAMR